MSCRTMANRPCPDCKRDTLFIGMTCSDCKFTITFAPVDFEYIGRVTQRPKLSDQELKDRKNARRRERRAMGAAE